MLLSNIYEVCNKQDELEIYTNYQGYYLIITELWWGGSYDGRECHAIKPWREERHKKAG